MATHVGFRLTKSDADIEKAISGFEDKTKRVKELIRLGLAVEYGSYVPEQKYAEAMGELEWRDGVGDEGDGEFEREEIAAALAEHREPISWKSFPKSNPSKPFFPALKVNTK